MTTLRYRIEKYFQPNLSSKCEKDRCTVFIGKDVVGKCTIVDCDTCTNRDFPGKRCDYILFYWGSEPNVAVLEFEGSTINKVSDWIEQLRAGLALVERITTPKEVSFCRTVVLHRSHVNKVTIRTVALRRVAFRGRNMPIVLRKCGARLDEVIG